MITKRTCEIWAQEKHFSRPLRSRLTSVKLNVSICRTGSFSGIQKALLTHQVWRESMQRGICLRAWMGPQSCSSFLAGTAGDSTNIPLLRPGVRGTAWAVAGNFYATSWEFHFQSRFFKHHRSTCSHRLRGDAEEAEHWPCFLAGRWFPWPSSASSRSSSRRSGCWSPGGMCSQTISPSPCWWSVCSGARYR